MHFVATHNVTAEDVTRALRLTARWTDLLLSTIVVVALAAILSQVLYAFSLYLRAASDAPSRLIDLIAFRYGLTDGVVAWLSIIVTICLPLFLFFAVRALVDTVHPAWRVERLMKTSEIGGPTTYTIDDNGVRSTRIGGADVFMPWASFDQIRSDTRVVALLRRHRLLFFVPIAAFGTQREEALAQIHANITVSRS